MKTIELLDTWRESGTNFKEFAARVEDITKSTIVQNIQTNSLGLYSVIPENCTDEKIALHAYTAAQTIERKVASRSLLSIATCRSKMMPEEFLQEILKNTRLLLTAGRNTTYFTSHYLCRDLAARADLGGDAIYVPSEERDAYIMSRYALKPASVHMVIRKGISDNGSVLYKVFALPSSSYGYIRQTILLDIFEELEEMFGKGQCEYWSIDHNLTKIWISFPDVAEDCSKVYKLPDVLVPGVLMETSDTGDCALRIVAAWKRKSSSARSTIGVYEREHRGRFSESEALKKVGDELATTYTRLPTRLCELLTIDLPEPDAAIEKAISMLGVSKAIGKKRTKILVEALLDELAPGTKMTGYDLAMLFMDLPSRFVGDERSKEFFEKAAGRLPFMDFDKIAAATTAVTLTSA